MKMSVLPSPGVTGRPSDSSTRALVVPTATSRCAALIFARGFCAHAIALGVHAVLAQVIHLHGPEGADADVQREKGVRHPREESPA